MVCLLLSITTLVCGCAFGIVKFELTKIFKMYAFESKYIEENYQHPISIDEISDVCHFSSSHFMKYFKKVMGTSFTDYLNEYRLSMASRLLLSSSDNILEIAAECGYDNLSYFNRLFKKKYGVTPSAYRNK